MKGVELGFFGNIWVRQNTLEKSGESFPGHKHHFDHVTLLVSGSMLVEVEGFEPRQFDAPTFIIIRKDHKHKVTALADNTLYYCVFALRDLDGEVVTDFNSQQVDPMCAAKKAG